MRRLVSLSTMALIAATAVVATAPTAFAGMIWGL